MHYIVWFLAVICVAGLGYWFLLMPPTPEDQGETRRDSEEVVSELPSPETVPEDVAQMITAMGDTIVLDAPAPYSTLTSPVTVSGRARGTWFFEGSFPITIVDWDGLIIGEGVATATGEWMTEEFVPFTATVTYTFDAGSYSDRGAIILRRDNPSGLPENDAALEIPVYLR